MNLKARAEVADWFWELSRKMDKPLQDLKQRECELLDKIGALSEVVNNGNLHYAVREACQLRAKDQLDLLEWVRIRIKVIEERRSYPSPWV